MKRIGLLSDTHHYLDPSIFNHFKDCDEIWHAGDFGTAAIADSLSSFKPLRGVYGNIDGRDIRDLFPEKLVFKCEDLTILMIHIGGYPGRYAPGLKEEIKKHKAGLFITGHSHILKIMYDQHTSCLHMNPGAAGNQGWHKIRTAIRFAVDGSAIKDCDVIELGKRGA